MTKRSRRQQSGSAKLLPTSGNRQAHNLKVAGSRTPVTPRFATEHRRFEMQDDAIANSFRTQYAMWLVVHALLMHHELEHNGIEDVRKDVLEEMTRQERCRHTVISAMVASQEVKSGSAAEEDSAAAA